MLTFEHGEPTQIGTRDPFELARLLRDVAEEHGVTVEELKSPRRARPLPQIRAVFCRRAWALGRHSCPQIGHMLNRQHHAVLYLLGRTVRKPKF